MASMRARLDAVKDDPSVLFDPACVARACEESGHRWRERVLGPLATLEAMALQMLHGNTAIGHVVRLAGGRFTESAYCQARARLPIAVTRASLGRVTAMAGTGGLWKGRRVVLIDGTGISVPDTPALRERFGTAGGLGEGCGLPCAKVLAVFRAHDGVLLDMHIAPASTGDLRHASDLHPAMEPGDVLVGDRGLCSYVHLAQLAQAGCHGLFRMQARRAMTFPARSGGRRRLAYNRHRRSEPVLVELIAQDDQVVEIVKPHNRPGHMNPGAFAAIPGRLVVRAVRYTVEQAGVRTREVTLLTTLTDAREYSAADLADLYLMRWRVEVNLRHLKRTLGMDRPRCASIEGVTREMLMLALIYNAVCRVRALAAAARGVEPVRLSFIDAVRAILVGITAGSPITLPCPQDIKRWPRRPRRVHPRQLKRKHSDYPVLIKPRASYIQWINTHTARTN